MADHPLRPAKDRCLGELLPHQLANLERVHPIAPEGFRYDDMNRQTIFGINPPLGGLSPTIGQVTHLLLTRSPLS